MLEHGADRLTQNFKIQPNVPITDILRIELDNLLEIRDVASAADLPHARNARFHRHAGAVMQLVFIPFVHRRRPRADKAHIALEHVEKLRKFVEASLDEFPQFFNVLKGDMSLVGTRPPTVDEWDKYELHHRARMAMKPGITGMWQVSGRSDITDFEQIVKLDTQYICNWNIGLDLKILCQTVSAVLKHKGAM